MDFFLFRQPSCVLESKLCSALTLCPVRLVRKRTRLSNKAYNYVTDIHLANKIMPRSKRLHTKQRDFCSIYFTRSNEVHMALRLVLKLPGMSTKQPAFAVDSHSNQRIPLLLLRPPLVRSSPLGVPCCK